MRLLDDEVECPICKTKIIYSNSIITVNHMIKRNGCPFSLGMWWDRDDIENCRKILVENKESTK